MNNDQSRINQSFNKAIEPKRLFERNNQRFLNENENVTEHKKAEGIVCKEQYVPSTLEMLQSLIPKMPTASPNNFCKKILQKSYKNNAKTEDID